MSRLALKNLLHTYTYFCENTKMIDLMYVNKYYTAVMQLPTIKAIKPQSCGLIYLHTAPSDMIKQNLYRKNTTTTSERNTVSDFNLFCRLPYTTIILLQSWEDPSTPKIIP